MRTAVLHWHTSSVGGINTTFQTLKKVALERGDTFDILASDPQKTKSPGLFIKPQRVRGGDTFINIDGTAPHHSSNWLKTFRFLRQNYDRVVLSFLCPHPTKAYGNEPLFLPLLKALADAGMPIVGYIHDGYWETYKEFGVMVLPLCQRTMVCQPAYGDPLVALGHPVTPAFVPFYPLADEPEVDRDPKLVVWLPQWKNIKGIYKFWEGLDFAMNYTDLKVEMYGNGIEYYNMRKDPELSPLWKTVIGKDHFSAEHCGNGPYSFHGCVPETEVAKILSRAAFMCDFQGSGRPKHEPYRNGSYNHTIIEALYYGCRPLVHANLLKSHIPAEFMLAIPNVEEWAQVAWKNLQPISADLRVAMREFIREKHDARKLYERIIAD